jgi:hypothetical protein
MVKKTAFKKCQYFIILQTKNSCFLNRYLFLYTFSFKGKCNTWRDYTALYSRLMLSAINKFTKRLYENALQLPLILPISHESILISSEMTYSIKIKLV